MLKREEQKEFALRWDGDVAASAADADADADGAWNPMGHDDY
jgi:hypothetical protein